MFTQCTQPDGTVAASSVAIASDMGVVLGHAEVMCLYWAESAGKNRLQCGTAGKVVIDGYLPPVTRKKRWYLIWR